MISEKSSTMFAPANIRLTRSQRRGISISPLAHCVWGKTEAFTPGNFAIWIVVVREIMVRETSHVGYVQRSGSPSEQLPIALTTCINQPALTVKPTAERTLALSTWSIAPWYVPRSLVLWLFAK